MNLSQDFVFFFTALGPNYSTSSAQLYGVTSDDTVVEIMAPSRVIDPLFTADEGGSLALDELGWAVFNDALTYFWSGTHYSGGQYSGTDTYIGQVHSDGRVEHVASELPMQSQNGFSDSVAVIDGDLYARFYDDPGQYWSFDSDLNATQLTGFSRPNASGALGVVTGYGDAVYFVADQQTPLGTSEIWRRLPDGTVEPALNITSSVEVMDMIAHEGSLFVAAVGYSGEVSRMFRFDTPTGNAVELPSLALIRPTGFKVIDGDLYLHGQKGLYPVLPDGTLGDNLFTTLGIPHHLWEVVELDGEIYAAISGTGGGQVLARLNADGTYETLFDVPGFAYDRVQQLTVHNGALYFEGGRLVDDGYGGTDLDQENLYRLEADGSFTLLADYYGIGTLIPYLVDVPGPEEAQYIEGDDGPDNLRGFGGNDTMVAGDGNNTVLGDAGDDVITAGWGNDFIGGGSGDDRITVLGGANTIYGGLGNDTVQGGSGNDTIYGGGDGRNVLLGNGGDDWLSGGSGGDYMGGGAGNDTVLGNAGDDTIYGGGGDDLLGGGAGNDLIFGSPGANRIYTGGGQDTVQGGAGNDAIYGSGLGAKNLWGNDGDDTINGAQGDDLLVGGAGNDRLFGFDGDDLIFLGRGNDFVGGGAGNDQITAGAGTNTIYGGVGNDTVFAGTGRDVITGGSGADVFVFNSAQNVGIGAGRDVIMDFESGIDKINLDPLNLTFIGDAAFSGAAQLRYFASGSTGFAVGDVNGDGVGDFTIQLNGAPILAAGDLIL